jgi:hypothetical protein
MMASNAPVLPAYPTAHGWRVWCVHCNRRYQHCPVPGHWAAHCRVATSPYKATGYVLELVVPE